MGMWERTRTENRREVRLSNCMYNLKRCLLLFALLASYSRPVVEEYTVGYYTVVDLTCIPSRSRISNQIYEFTTLERRRAICIDSRLEHF